MKKTHPRTRCLGLPSNVENIGIVSWTPIFTKALGRSNRTKNCSNMSSSFSARRNGLRSPSSWRAEQKTLWRIGLTFCWILRERSQANFHKRGFSKSASTGSCSRKGSSIQGSTCTPPFYLSRSSNPHFRMMIRIGRQRFPPLPQLQIRQRLQLI